MPIIHIIGCDRDSSGNEGIANERHRKHSSANNSGTLLAGKRRRLPKQRWAHTFLDCFYALALRNDTEPDAKLKAEENERKSSSNEITLVQWKSNKSQLHETNSRNILFFFSPYLDFPLKLKPISVNWLAAWCTGISPCWNWQLDSEWNSEVEKKESQLNYSVLHPG